MVGKPKKCQTAPIFKCKTCKNTFKRKYNLNIHEKFHCRQNYNKAAKNETCPICNEKYTHNGLRYHLLKMGNAKLNGRQSRAPHANHSAREHFDHLEKLKKKFKKHK